MSCLRLGFRKFSRAVSHNSLAPEEDSVVTGVSMTSNFVNDAWRRVAPSQSPKQSTDKTQISPLTQWITERTNWITHCRSYLSTTKTILQTLFWWLTGGNYSQAEASWRTRPQYLVACLPPSSGKKTKR